MRLKLGTFAMFVACLSLATQAEAGKLKVGDAAPGIDIEEWVKGEEVTIESGNIYVVEFWATWCAPCRKSIPHLTELQDEYGEIGLTIIGVSDEEASKVRPFVEKQGDNMNYTVAVDRRNSTKRAWFDAAGQKGIPAAFIVDRDSKVVFIGHPLSDDFQETLNKVARGRFNPTLEKEAKPTLRLARRAKDTKNWRMAMKHYDEVVALDPRVFAEIALERFKMMLIDMKERDLAYAYARDELIGNHFVTDPEAMGLLAQMIVADPDIPADMRDEVLALEAAEGCVDLSNEGRSKALALSMMAKVRYHRGEFNEAVNAQKRAYFLVNPRHKTEYRRVLRNYQQAAKGDGDVSASRGG
jgi:thiol-disulfide isomerase/thioredoxin